MVSFRLKLSVEKKNMIFGGKPFSIIIASFVRVEASLFFSLNDCFHISAID